MNQPHTTPSCTFPAFVFLPQGEENEAAKWDHWSVLIVPQWLEWVINQTPDLSQLLSSSHTHDNRVLFCFHSGLVCTGRTGNLLELSLHTHGWVRCTSDASSFSSIRWTCYGLFFIVGFSSWACHNTEWELHVWARSCNAHTLHPLSVHQQLCTWCCVISLTLLPALLKTDWAQ